jgi:hypothetical protein
LAYRPQEHDLVLCPQGSEQVPRWQEDDSAVHPQEGVQRLALKGVPYRMENDACRSYHSLGLAKSAVK